MVDQLQQRDLDLLSEGHWPERYQGNQGTLRINDQIRLLCSTVVVAGCGGLGGCAIEILARMGIGQLIMVDPRRFEAADANRQIHCTTESIGQPKVQVIARRLMLINPAIRCHALHKTIAYSFPMIQAKADVVVDCLNDDSTSRELGRLCSRAQLPLVHGAVWGARGQVAVQGSHSSGLLDRILLDPEEERPPTPALPPLVMHVGSILAMETCKLLLGITSRLHGSRLGIDLQQCTFRVADA